MSVLAIQVVVTTKSSSHHFCLAERLVFSQEYELIEFLSAFAFRVKIFASMGVSLQDHTVTASTADYNP